MAQVVRVVDGDTIDVTLQGRSQRVRIIGLDTPELTGAECYADAATDRLADIIGGGRVLVEADSTQDDVDAYGRLLRHVATPGGSYVAATLIRAGLGREYTFDRPYRHRSEFLAAQRNAEAAERGVWSGSCLDTGDSPPVTRPSTKPPRAQASSPAATTSPDAAGQGGSCDIKGNISSEDERIYHLPGQRNYADTKISPSKGERWFCSESAAREAGWRKAKV